MNIRKCVIAATSGALLGTSSLSFAEATIDFPGAGSLSFSANVAMTTDYVWRYVSQSDQKGAIQGGFDMEHSSGLYAGTWGSNVDFDDDDGDPSMEFDLYGGFGHEFANGVGIDVGLINYRYPGKQDYNWVEYYAGLSYSVAGVGLNGTINYSNDVFGTDETGIFYSLGGEYTVEAAFPITLSADYGYYDFDINADPDSYSGWHIGAAVDVKGFVFDLSYYDTNGDGEDLFGDWADDRIVGSVSVSF